MHDYTYRLFDFNTTQTLQETHIAVGFYNTETGIATLGDFPNYNGGWIMINLQEEIVLNKVIFYCTTDGSHTAPNIFRIYATNDISSFNTPSYTDWTIIHDQTTQLTEYVDGEPKEVNMINNTAAFSIYALVVNQLSGLNTARLTFSEWELYGSPLITTGSVKTLIDDVVLNASNLDTSNYIKKLDTSINQKVDAMWIKDGSDVYNATNNIGIGTTTTSFKLEVAGGNTKLGGTLEVNGNTIFNGITTIDGDMLVQNTGSTLQTNLTIANNDGTKNVKLLIGSAENTEIGNGNFGIYMNDDYRMTILQNGNVGIGKTDPAVLLDVNGDANIGRTLKVGDDIMTKKDILNWNNIKKYYTIQNGYYLEEVSQIKTNYLEITMDSTNRYYLVMFYQYITPQRSDTILLYNDVNLTSFTLTFTYKTNFYYTNTDKIIFTTFSSTDTNNTTDNIYIRIFYYDAGQDVFITFSIMNGIRYYTSWNVPYSNFSTSQVFSFTVDGTNVSFFVNGVKNGSTMAHQGALATGKIYIGDVNYLSISSLPLSDLYV
jgi:hypothetical protein